MRIGIGVTTYLRPECLAKWKEQIAKHIDFDISNSNDYKTYGYDKNGNAITIYIADDSKERKGVAFRKNECLRALKDCDYVFLFDDDTYPIKDGWIEFFVEASKQTGKNHFLYLSHDFHLYKFSSPKYNSKINDTLMSNCINYHYDCGGVFMFMTKEAIEKVGAFNEKFDTWGFEHAEYSVRILGEHGEYPCLNATSAFIYSEDYSNPNHKSSITNEEKDLLFKKNFPIFAKGVEKTYIPL